MISSDESLLLNSFSCGTHHDRLVLDLSSTTQQTCYTIVNRHRGSGRPLRRDFMSKVLLPTDGKGPFSLDVERYEGIPEVRTCRLKGSVKDISQL